MDTDTLALMLFFLIGLALWWIFSTALPYVSRKRKEAEERKYWAASSERNIENHRRRQEQMAYYKQKGLDPYDFEPFKSEKEEEERKKREGGGSQHNYMPHS